MPKDLVVPALGESISEAVISKWLKNIGDSLAANEPVVDLETDKVSVQLPAPTKGVLKEQRFAEGATVKVGEVIGLIDETAVTAEKAPAPRGARPAAAATPAATGAADKAAANARPAPTAPPDAAPTAPPGDGRAATEATPPTADPHLTSIPLSPARRRALREAGATVDAAATVLAPRLAVAPAPSDQAASAAAAAAPWAQPSAASTPAAAPTAPVAPGEREQVVPMTPLRKRIAERLVLAQHTAAVLTTFNEVDMSAVMALRSRFQDAFVAKHGIKLGFMSFFTKAVVAALREFPMLNAELRGTDIVLKHHYDIGIAVGSGRGLVVPVLRHADQLGFAEIEQGIAALATKAKDNKLTLEDLSGGTFTITNGGIYGSMMSTPLLNYPQTGILGMHNVVKRPVVVGDQVQIRPMMYVALSYDHRLVDGREAVQCLVGVKERIENPERLLFSL